MNLEVILGPPGTGKTTTLMQIVGSALDSGVRPDRIGFVSFTKAAVREAKDRAQAQYGLTDADLPFWRTLHSMGLALQGRAGFSLLTDKDMREFEASAGFSIAAPADEDGFARAEGAGHGDDQILADVYQWCRARREPVPVGCSTWLGDPVDAAQVAHFARKYEAMKAATGKSDYTDMLEGALDKAVPGLDLLVVDEAQDLSPLQQALAERMMGAAVRVFVAGDDDQAIMGFQGADAKWLMRLSTEHRHRVLAQSFRVPSLAHSMATQVSSRIVERIRKDYAPKADAGWVQRAPDDIGPEQALNAIMAGQSVAWLARTRFQLQRAALALYREGVPFLAERGGRNPLGSPSKLAAARCARRVMSHLVVDAEDVVALLKHVSTKGGNLPRGAKTKAAQLTGSVTSQDAAAVGLTSLWRRIEVDGLDPLDGLEADDRAYYAKVLRPDGSTPDRVCTVTTMHASKGREWDVVMLSTEHSKAVDRALAGPPVLSDPEHRVAYVAVTRTKRGLLLLDPPRGLTYPYPQPRRKAA
jgi:superfamily I DNA/RNA helicase